MKKALNSIEKAKRNKTNAQRRGAGAEVPVFDRNLLLEAKAVRNRQTSVNKASPRRGNNEMPEIIP